MRVWGVDRNACGTIRKCKRDLVSLYEDEDDEDDYDGDYVWNVCSTVSRTMRHGYGQYTDQYICIDNFIRIVVIENHESSNGLTRPEARIVPHHWQLLCSYGKSLPTHPSPSSSTGR